jgi:antitoxin (DNA-binding transcriptional repressor) of toxin-antitoxin stability system
MKAKTSGGSGRRARYAVNDTERAAIAEESAEDAAAGVRRISATEAARNFSDLINRVGYSGERYIIERGGRAMCELSPVAESRFTGADFLALLSTLARPCDEFLSALDEILQRQAVVERSAWEA